MGACKNCKGTLTEECGELIFAPCVVIQAELNEISEFSGEDCVTLHDITPEIYDLLALLSLTGFDKKCLDIPDEATHLEIEQAQTDEICALKEGLGELQCLKGVLDLSVPPTKDCDASGLDVSCLEGDPCETLTPINTFGELIQVLINKVCDLEIRVLALENE